MQNLLADHLVHHKLLTTETATTAIHQANQQNLPFISYLTNNNILSNITILQHCASHFNLPIFNHEKYNLTALPDVISPEIAKRYRVVPLAEQDQQLHVAISDPTDQTALDTLTFHYGLAIYPILMTEDQLNLLLEKYCNQTIDKNYLNLAISTTMRPIIQDNPTHDDEPLIKLVDNILQHALQKSASDIHIEPQENYCRVRYRQDGILYSITEIPLALADRLIARLKVMARLDISERRLPQDGRLQHHQPSSSIIDIRISTCPTLLGEKIVLRILDTKKFSLDVEKLGMLETQKTTFLSAISQPQGMIIVTGPTGSGKTVTLYSALHHLNSTDKNISSAEDPIEIHLPGINQVNINPKIGLHFSTLLRTFLRQDPDILMIGEIRDAETAEIAIQAAQTGHLVLSSTHANSAIETIKRLQTLKIKATDIISTVSLIIAQRLARKLCEHCKQFDFTMDCGNKAYRPLGCRHCLQGYAGRIGIYETLAVDTTLMQKIQRGEKVEEELAKRGFINLQQAGRQKVAEGITSLAEIHRVIGKKETTCTLENSI